MVTESRQKLIYEVNENLNSAGFESYYYNGVCFDIVAKNKRNEKDLLFLKILFNIDSIQFQQAKNLKILSNMLNAFACIVGVQTRYEKLKNNVIYERFGLPSFTSQTLKNILLNKLPFLFRTRGGLFTEINPEKLKKARKKRNITQKELADMIGITKKSIYEHEKNKMKALFFVAVKIERVLGAKVSEPLEFSNKKFIYEQNTPITRLENEVLYYFKKIGFETSLVYKTPFNIIAKENNIIFGYIEKNRKETEKIVNNLKKISDILRKPSLIITNKKYEADYEVPLIEKRELKHIRSPKELIKNIEAIRCL